MKEYDRIILRLFEVLYAQHGDVGVLAFTKDEMEQVADELGIVIKNVPDILYTYRSGRSPLPDEILARGEWALRGAGKGSYEFVRLTRSPHVQIPDDIEITPILDATPQIVLKYQSADEQALLARLRFNRLVDIFTGLTAYHLQGHFRTTVSGLGQVEIDDLYIGVNENGQGFLLPLEAKSDTPKDQLGVIQITQMVLLAREHFRDLPVRPIGVKAMPDGSLVFLEFNAVEEANDMRTRQIKRYRLYREF